MAQDGITLTLSVEGEAQASQALDRVTDATKRTDAQAQAFQRSTGQMRAGLQAAAQATQALGGQLGAVNPVLGSAVGALGQMATGAGAAAVGAGLVTTALVAIGQGLYDSTQRLNTFADKLVSSTNNLYDYVRAARAAREAQASLNQLLAGTGSAEDQAALLAGLRARAYGLSVQAQDRGPDSMAARQLREVQDQILRTQRNIAAGPRGTVSDVESTTTEFEDVAPLTGRAAREALRDQGYIVRGNRIANDNGRRGGGGRRQADSSWMTAGIAEKQAAQGRLADEADKERASQRGHEEFRRAQQRAEEEAATAHERLTDRLRAKDEEAAKQRLAELDEWGAKGEAVASTLYDAFETVASGQATLAQAAANLFKQTLAQFAKSEMLEAGKEIGLAIGSLAMENYPGAAKHFASAAQHGLVAAAAGGAASLLGSASGGGGGARSNVRPEAAGGGASGRSGPTTVVVNLPATTILAGTHADAGRMISRALQAEAVMYGTGIAA